MKNPNDDSFQGEIIKKYRKEKKMTQAQLAHGIVSVSYLSKIEKGISKPSKEIQQQLIKKLNISSTISFENLELICKKWFEHLLRGEITEATNYFNTHINNKDEFLLSSYKHLIDLHKISLYVQCKDFSMASKQIESSRKDKRNYNQVEMYYWHKFTADYCFYNNFFQDSLNLYLDAKEFIGSSLLINNEEENDLYYLVSLAASKIGNTHIILTYAQIALNYYKDIYVFKRMAECHVLLGIGYRGAGNLDKSKSNYDSALKLANFRNDSYIKEICYQNLGKLSEEMNNTDKAIHYYKKSYDLSNNKIDKLISISSLMKLFYKLYDTKQTKEWLNKGIALSAGISPEESVYVFEFKVYKYLLNGQEQELELYVSQTVLPHLEQKQIHGEIYHFSNLMADYYFTQRKYKPAAMYYKKALIHKQT
ncbi:helix-turn-helix domain-containing protein [Paraliobacillus ryukyuensis]|uniref:helix-turn-helix domain-containing protein n=1 Tax=Paraliobacillus ryukyuensis TaxID=200904 RepID=UPI0009A8EB81|nr:helix-turn-helix domain-containing protein [Paraliobacillus ryukyuensis]